jgi:hypothetical protein
MTNATHFRISEFLPKLKKIPIIGKALVHFLSAAHVMIVYNDVLKKGQTEWLKTQNQRQPQPQNPNRPRPTRSNANRAMR